MRIQLELEEWPNVYMFKFIMPNENEKIAKITAMFDQGAEIHFQPSSNDKYICITAKEMMLNVDSIIEKYVEASQIKGVIAL